MLETTVSSEARSEHPEAASSAKPTSAAREGEPTLPVIRHAPAMSVLPERDKSSKEPHCLQLRELVKERIKKVEFDVALELFSAVVARLVPKAKVANTPKAQAALDKEWENLRKKGTWDEFRVNECRRVIREAQNKGEKVHIEGFSRLVTRKVVSFPMMIPTRNSKEGPFSKGTMFTMRTLLQHYLRSYRVQPSVNGGSQNPRRFQVATRLPQGASRCEASLHPSPVQRRSHMA